MQRFRKSLLVLCCIIAICLMFPAADVCADETNGSVYFEQYISMQLDAKAPAVIFDYKIDACQDPADSTKDLLPFAGAPYIENGQAQFAPTNSASLEMAATRRTVGFATEGNDQDEKYVCRQVWVDFTKVEFQSAGRYWWRVACVTPEESGLEPDDIGYRYICAYVRETRDGRFLATGYSVFAPCVTDDGVPSVEESTGFTSVYHTSNIFIAVETRGRKASSEKYFQVTIALRDTNEDNHYSVRMDAEVINPTSNADTLYGTQAMQFQNGIQTTSTGIPYLSGERLKYGYAIYLKSGQTVELQGVGVGTAYEITEAPEDYWATNGVDCVLSSGKTVRYDDPTSGTIGDTDIHVGFMNVKHLTIIEIVLLIAAALVLIALLISHRKSKRLRQKRAAAAMILTHEDVAEAIHTEDVAEKSTSTDTTIE